jgi:hypothetical protein
VCIPHDEYARQGYCHGRQPGVLRAGSTGPLGFGLGLSPSLEVKEVPLFKERGCNNQGKQYQTNQSSFSSSFAVISSSFSTIPSPVIRHLTGNYPPRPKGRDNLVSWAAASGLRGRLGRPIRVRIRVKSFLRGQGSPSI